MSQTLDTALGLVLVFALSALFCSAIVEAWATVTERRAKYLITALRSMLDTPESGAGGKRTPGLKPAALHKLVKEREKAAELAPKNLAETAAFAVGTRRAKEIRAARGPQATEADVAVPDKPAGEIDGAITASLFLHPMIRGLQTRTVRLWFDGRIRNPQYIPAATFTRALIGTFLPDGSRPNDPDVVRDLRAVVESLPGEFEVRQSLLTLIDQADDDIHTLQKSVEEWYDAQMGRISGWYKRWTQAVLLGVGLAFAALGNVDTLQIGHALWVDERVRTAVAESVANGSLCATATAEDGDTEDEGEGGAGVVDGGTTGPATPAAPATTEEREDCAMQALADLKLAGVPLGHAPDCAPLTNLGPCFTTPFSIADPALDALVKVVGWGITAGAVSFGAPFWFQALSRIGSLRSSGPKPPAEETT